MTIFENMKQMSSQFTKTEKQIYDSIQKIPEQYAVLSLPDLVLKTGFSQAALTRFAKKLGFSGFTQFQYQYQIDLKQNTSEHSELTRAQYYGNYLQETEDVLRDETMSALAQKILCCDKLFISGSHLSSLPAKYLDYSLKVFNSVFSYVFIPSDGLPVISEKDIYLVFSAWNGSDHEQIVKSMQASDIKPYRILITLNPKHPFRKYFDEVIVLPKNETVRTQKVLLSETLAFLMFDDLLVHSISS